MNKKILKIDRPILKADNIISFDKHNKLKELNLTEKEEYLETNENKKENITNDEKL